MAILYDVDRCPSQNADQHPFSDEILRNCRWIVYWYNVENYDGYGEAVSWQLDGRLILNDLGHCSCYGPIDHWGENEITVEQLQNGLQHVLAEVCEDRVARKVLELMGENT